MRYLSWAYLLALFAFILLPVVTLVIFSFQDGRLPVPPFKGATLDWYREILTDRALMEALANSLIVALLSALAQCVSGMKCSVHATEPSCWLDSLVIACTVRRDGDELLVRPSTNCAQVRLRPADS